MRKELTEISCSGNRENLRRNSGRLRVENRTWEFPSLKRIKATLLSECEGDDSIHIWLEPVQERCRNTVCFIPVLKGRAIR
jgi:hypothetical protein